MKYLSKVVLLAALLVGACGPASATGPMPTNMYRYEVIFDHDGCRVYHLDGGIYVVSGHNCAIAVI